MTTAPDLPTEVDAQAEAEAEIQQVLDDKGPNYLHLSDVMTDEEFTAQTKILLATRQANAQLLHELQQIGFSPEFNVSMLAMYFEGLVQVGVLSRAQLLRIEKFWEEGFHRQLQTMLKTGKEAVATIQARTALLVPPGHVQGPQLPNRAQRRSAARQGLIVPGQ